MDAAHTKPNAGALVREKQIHKGAQKDNGDRNDRTTPVGYALDTDPHDQTEDDLDAEFERY
jgi:hypothetical protein